MARPKKTILLYGNSAANRIAELRFMFETRGYAVTDDRNDSVDLTLMVDEDKSAMPLALGFSATPGVPSLIVNTSMNHAQLLEHVRIILQRKRGPKKGALALRTQMQVNA
jgi:hypothetical protein